MDLAKLKLQIVRLVVPAFLLASSLPAFAQSLSEPLRQVSPEFASFYFKRLDRWIETNHHDFKKNLSAKELSLFNDLIGSQKALVLKSEHGVFRPVSYSIRFNLNNVLESTVTLIDFKGDLRQQILDVAKLKGLKAVSAGAKAYGLRWSSVKPLELVTFDGEKLDFSNSEGLVESRSVSTASDKVASAATCPGVYKDGSIDVLTKKNGKLDYLVTADQVESEAYGPAGRDLHQKFRRGLNLSPGLVRCASPEDTEFYYP